MPPKSKDSQGEFPYNTEEKCLDYPGTKCKLGNQCGSKGNARFLIIFRDGGGAGGRWPQKISTSMHGVKSATLEIANLTLLTPCTEFENFCDQILSFEVL